MPSSRLPKWFPASVGLAIFLLALGLRVFGLSWGLPDEKHEYGFHPDEPIVYAVSQQVKPALGRLTPGFYNYGTFYLSAASIATDFASSYSASIEAGPNQGTWQMRRGILAGRWVNVLAGAGTALLVFLLLLRRTHLLGAALGGLAMAVAPAFVVHSRFQTVDVFATLWFTASLYAAMRYAENTEDRYAMRWALLAGVLAGFAAGTKYNAVLAVAALFPVAYKAKGGVKAVLASSAVCIAGFFVTTPGVLLESARFQEHFQYEMWHTSSGHGLVFAGTSPGFLYQLSNLLEATGPAFLLIALFGLYAMVSKRSPESDSIRLGFIGLLTVALLYYILIGRAEVKFLRYVFPLLPVLAIGFGFAVGYAHLQKSRAWQVLVAVAIFAVGSMVARTAENTQLMMSPDPRDLAATTLQNRSSVGLVSDPWFYSPSLYPSIAAPRYASFEQRELIRAGARNPVVLRYIPANPSERQDWDVRLLEELAPDAVVFSSFEADDYDRLLGQKKPPAEYAGQLEQYRVFRDRLHQDYRLERAFGTQGSAIHDMMYIQPRIWIWRRKP